MGKRFGKIAGDERGATLTEYALLLAGITLVVIGAVYAFGGSVRGLYESFFEQFPGS